MLITIKKRKNAPQKSDRNYEASRQEYARARELFCSDDDDTYYQKLESLIIDLEQKGWL